MLMKKNPSSVFRILFLLSFDSLFKPSTGSTKHLIWNTFSEKLGPQGQQGVHGTAPKNIFSEKLGQQGQQGVHGTTPNLAFFKNSTFWLQRISRHFAHSAQSAQMRILPDFVANHFFYHSSSFPIIFGLVGALGGPKSTKIDQNRLLCRPM